MPQFDRRISVTIGEPGATGVTIEDLDVSFEIEKFAEGQPGIGRIEIYNLSETTRSQIKAGRDVAILKAGYAESETGEAVCCQMDIFDARTTRKGPDNVTEISCGDGINVQRGAKLSVSFAGSRGVKQMIRDVVGQIGSSLKDPAMDGVADGTMENGFSEAGTGGDVLDRLCGKLGATWSFQDGQIEVAPRDAPPARVIVVVKPESGLIGRPEKRNKVESVFVPFVRPGWIIKTLLDPRIIPNGRVRLEASEGTGVYRVLSVKHTGYTRGNAFHTVADLAEW
jgi:hypothetical protein